jgi:glycosyltransferase involved in cell wall biosynthesis
MPRIAVITSGLPFGEGGHLVIVRALADALREAGHRAEVVVTPQNRFGRQAAAYLATWLTDVGVAQDGGKIDQVISFRYPSYAVRHDAHVCWLNHRMREYYDLWDELRVRLTPAQRVKERARRRLIHAADRWLLTHNVDRLFAQSDTIRRRLERFGGIRSEVLYPPPPPRPYRCDRYGDYLFAVSRLAPLKRFDLLLRALARPEAREARLVIAGEGEARADLERLIVERDLSRRVRLVGAIDGEQLIGHLASCRAVCFPTRAEDFGLVTVEAFASRKAVVTCTDSGGPAELVRDGVEGFVAAPTPEALAPVLGRLAADEALACRMGEAGLQAVSTLTWARTVERLVMVS